jgi:hypothetical protein
VLLSIFSPFIPFGLSNLLPILLNPTPFEPRLLVCTVQVGVDSSALRASPYTHTDRGFFSMSIYSGFERGRRAVPVDVKDYDVPHHTTSQQHVAEPASPACCLLG